MAFDPKVHYYGKVCEKHPDGYRYLKGSGCVPCKIAADVASRVRRREAAGGVWKNLYSPETVEKQAQHFRTKSKLRRLTQQNRVPLWADKKAIAGV